MSKTTTAFFCRSCGAQSPKWIGRCPACGEWNTYVEEVLITGPKKVRPGSAARTQARPLRLEELEQAGEKRIPTHDGELDRVLGGGMVPGSLVLVGGEPGIGKSTLLLQVALKTGKKVLYVSGEESGQQIRMRAERIGGENPGFYIMTETGTANILHQLEELKPDLVIIDSIQTLHTDIIDSTSGSISQIRECAAELQRWCKESQVPVFLIGHITKDGMLAGPKLLEHMVDTVLHFEGERHYGYRVLRSVKNRFGPASELGIYEMHDGGLREVMNPSEILISRRDEEVSGVAIAATVEGLRPILIEIQALVSSAAYGTPQRSATGFDGKRLNMLLAVLEKRCGFRLGMKDVFVNIAGGFRVDDPATDLAVVAAILSSNEDIAVDHRTAFAAEVGLSGEIRAVSHIEQRISEAAKLGFKKIIISKYHGKGVDLKKHKISVVMIGKIEELLRELFG